jgi:hypothetical protein
MLQSPSGWMGMRSWGVSLNRKKSRICSGLFLSAIAAHDTNQAALSRFPQMTARRQTNAATTKISAHAKRANARAEAPPVLFNDPISTNHLDTSNQKKLRMVDGKKREKINIIILLCSYCLLGDKVGILKGKKY